MAGAVPEGFVPSGPMGEAPIAAAAPPPASASPTAPAAPAAKPDIVGRAKAALTAAPPEGSPRAGVAGSVVRGAGEVLLPGSIPEAAFMGGQMLAAPMAAAGVVLPYVSRLTMPLLRTILGSISQGTASALTGQGFAGAAESGAKSALIGEGLGAGLKLAGKVVTKTAEHSPIVGGMIKSRKAAAASKEEARVNAPIEAWKAAEATKADTYKQASEAYKKDIAAYKTEAIKARQEQIAGNVGEFAERVPPFAGIKNASQLEALAREKQAPLGQYFENRIKEADAKIGGQTIRVPSLATDPNEAVITQYGPMPASMLGLGAEAERMTLTDAAKALTNLRVAAYGGAKNDPTARTIAGLDSRKRYGTALREIEAELGSHSPEALAAWTDGRKAMAVGSTLIDLLQKSGLWMRDTAGQELTTPRLQALVSQHRGWLKERMGADDFKALMHAVLAGGRLGQADVYKGTVPQFTGSQPNVRPQPTAPTKPTPSSQPAPLPASAHYPVDLPQIMINAQVQRLVNQ